MASPEALSDWQWEAQVEGRRGKVLGLNRGMGRKLGARQGEADNVRQGDVIRRQYARHGRGGSSVRRKRASHSSGASFDWQPEDQWNSPARTLLPSSTFTLTTTTLCDRCLTVALLSIHYCT